MYRRKSLWADFWEFSSSRSIYVKVSSEWFCTKNVVARWLLRNRAWMIMFLKSQLRVIFYGKFSSELTFEKLYLTWNPVQPCVYVCMCWVYVDIQIYTPHDSKYTTQICTAWSNLHTLNRTTYTELLGTHWWLSKLIYTHNIDPRTLN